MNSTALNVYNTEMLSPGYHLFILRLVYSHFFVYPMVSIPLLCASTYHNPFELLGHQSPLCFGYFCALFNTLYYVFVSQGVACTFHSMLSDTKVFHGFDCKWPCFQSIRQYWKYRFSNVLRFTKSCP